MKIFAAIAAFAFSSCAWADPLVSLTVLRHNLEEHTYFVQVEVEQLQDLKVEKSCNAYAVFYCGENLSWICNLAWITPQTEKVGVVTWVTEKALEECTEAEIVLSPGDEIELSKIIWDKRFRPQHHPSFSPIKEQRLRGNTQFQQQCEAVDASVGINSRELCHGSSNNNVIDRSSGHQTAGCLTA